MSTPCVPRQWHYGKNEPKLHNADLHQSEPAPVAHSAGWMVHEQEILFHCIPVQWLTMSYALSIKMHLPIQQVPN